MKLNINKNLLNDLHMAVYAALWDSYVGAIIENTPVDTGMTKMQWDFYPVAPFQYKLVNTNGEVILYLEKGTGIYGPRKRKIVPVRAKALRWYDRSTGTFRFAKSVKGIKPMKFVEAVLEDPVYMQKYKTALKQYMKEAKKKASKAKASSKT